MNEMNDVLNKFKEERELLMRTFTQGYKKLSKDKDEELEKMLKKAMEEERSELEDLEYMNLEVVDEEDAKLKNLSEEWGLGRRREERIPVLWNFEHGRKATLKEGIVAHMKHQINNLKRKRT
ncbi:hypothetical protein F2Q69_00056981 [Brassica cretica]|uniref:Factor of DNA methylation 1-5/IDN2 domain-containing protein n=1 Tax=Brassica cretica TaxID=69181 RepID=A0A8S9N9C0_BRACR|nr:hypothetical protein F2Q69_00056981 [Brassica cretica]